MKFRSLIAAVAAFGALAAGTAKADVINYNGSNVNMNLTHVGQTGTINNISSDSFTFGNFVGINGLVYGYLPKMAQITFHYSFTPGVQGADLTSYISYDYTKNGHEYHGASTGDSTTGVNNYGFVDTTPGTSLVFATANFNTVPTGTSTGTTQITNYTSIAEQFSSALYALVTANPHSIGTITYSISNIPLPASFPIMVLALGGMLALAHQKRKATLA